jgi:arabinose-5-phosphate isomerase
MSGNMVRRATEVLRLESRGIEALADRLDDQFVAAVKRILETPGRTVVSGIGKSGLVARKIASTLASTGTPALFLHPTEGAHGDVGVLVRGDLLLAVSNSGESAELADLMPVVKRLDIPVIALTGEPESTLGRYADIVLYCGVETEACPHDLAPTASTTAALALGDALAIVLLEERGFGAEDFARLHPGGRLGRRLLWRVADVMVTAPDELAVARPETGLAEGMRQIAHRRGTVAVVDDNRRVVGVLTAGDLTRFADSRADFLERTVRDAMNPSPEVVEANALAIEAVRAMEANGIMAMPVVNGDAELVGIVHLHDLLRQGVA